MGTALVMFVALKTDVSLVFDLTSYLPDFVLPQYVAAKDAVLSLLDGLGVTQSHAGQAAGK